MTIQVFDHERTRHFDDWWRRALTQYKFTDDPKGSVAGLQGDFMLICMRAYEQGREDECFDFLEANKEKTKLNRE
mgnify:CR=1 FL=1